MLSPQILQALNDQIALEAYSSFSYLAMASWCDKEGLQGCADFFYAQSDEERMHMLKLVHYVNEMDEHALIPSVEQPQTQFESITAIFKSVYAQERKVTDAINSILSTCKELNDHVTTNFLQWYVTEQREEEALVREILDKIRLIGEGGQSLYFINKEIEAINKRRMAQAAAEPEAKA
jgi:ferritin